jgi:hypothetical protein
MKIAIKMLILLGVVFVAFSQASSAYAQATRTWVSGVGDDANPCSRTAPCKTFAGAISKTAPGGEINCLDPGGFGAVTITKAMTISCQAGTAGVLVSGTNGIIVAAAAADAVYLKGLDFEGVGTGLAGIKFNSGASLVVEDCTIRDFRASNGIGISFNPTGTSSLVVRNTTVSHNGDAVSGGGIVVAPSGSGVGKAHLVNVTVGNNFHGVVALGATATVEIDSSAITGNAGNGIISINGATARVGRSSINYSASAATSGNVLSFNDNQIFGNTPDTVPTLANYH